MTTHGRDWNELKLVEDPAVAYLQQLGFHYVDPTSLDALAERPALKQPILTARLTKALHKLNPWLTPDNAHRAAKALTTQVSAATLAESNEAVYTTLTYGTTVEQDRGDGARAYTVRFLDFDHPNANELVVTRQFRVGGTKKEIRPDVVLFVNGIPLVVIECKSPTLGEKWREEAIRQLTRYQETDDAFQGQGAPQLFHTVQLVIGTCGEQAAYGTVGTPSRYFLEWKDPWPATVLDLERDLGRKPSAQDRLIAGLLRPESLLDVIQNFIVFDAENGRTVKKVCRYRQFKAVNQALQRIHAAKRPEERGGVVWHTQGSGKSLTMLWLALKLRRDPKLDNPGLVLVTDRTDLDRQLTGTFRQCGFAVDQAPSVKALRTMLRNLGGHTVTTTIQKFQDATTAADPGARRVAREVHPTLNEAENIFVMVDEAHRTQYAGLAANLRKALPNACFLGFTGTPIDKRDRSTLQTFGPYIDKYTIEQAVEDGATVPIFYESRLPEVSIVGANLDKLFDAYFADRTDEERVAIKRRYATEAAVASAPRRIEMICLDLLEHFRTAIAPNGFKAQIVAQDRDTAVTYKETLDRLNAPASVLIMSVAHNDGDRLVRATPPKDKQRQFIEAFKAVAQGPYILVVCDMLITGFDAPVEQVMYLDKPLKEHTLLQAIARTNRTADGKTYGLIVDYWGVSKDLQEALAIFSSSDVEGALKPKLAELPLLQTRHSAAMRFFARVKDKDDLNACVEVLEPEDVREDFNQTFKRFAKSMDMLLPQPEALPYADDLKWLGKIRATAKARFRDHHLDLSGCGEKVRALIESAISADRISILVKEVSLFSKDFEDKLKALKSDSAKASEMEHAIKNEIHVHLDENPAFYESLRERLLKILEDRKAERITSAEQLRLFQELRKEAEAPKQAAAKLGLDEAAFAIWGLVKDKLYDPDQHAGVELATVLQEAVAPYTRMVDWQTKDDLQRQMRRDIRKKLRQSGLDGDAAADLAEDIVDLAKARSSGEKGRA